MKQLFSTLLLTLLLCMSGNTAYAHDIEVANADGVTIYYNYLRTNSVIHLEVTYQGSSASDYSYEYYGNIVIPEYVTFEGNSYQVTNIGMRAFQDCTGLASITLPKSVKYFGSWAFSGCTGLSAVYISDLTTWCNTFFNTIDSNPLYYAHRLFVDGTEVKNLILPSGFANFGSYTFAGCSALTSLVIPSTLLVISHEMFYGCSGLTSISIPSNVVNIENGAFMNCSGLQSIDIPSSVTSIKASTFSGCSNLSSISIPSSVTSIEGWAFEGCSSLSSFSIPSGLTCVREGTFKNCMGLKSIDIPSSITYVEHNAFEGCTSLDSVKINDLFSWCGIDFYDHYSNPLFFANHLYLNGDEIKNLMIPTGLTEIKWIAFENCSGLNSIFIPSSVTKIGNFAFSGCNEVEHVSVEWESPITQFARDFTNRANATLYVPFGSKEAYLLADYWKEFKEIVERKKCATPAISFKDGKLHFECDTDGVEFHYKFTTPPSGNGTGNDVTISSIYVVNVYASKADYVDSDVATANINVAGKKGDVNQDGVVSISDAVSIVNLILESSDE